MTPWELELARPAQKAYLAMPASDHRAMRRTFDRLALDPRNVNLTKLEPHRQELWRVRSGRWRAVLTFDQARHVITVVDIDQRKDVYR